MNDDELKNLLRQNLEVARENNEILKRMVKMGRIAFWFKVIIWVIVLALPILLIPYILPLVRGFEVLNGVPGVTSTSSTSSLFGLPSPTEVQHAIEEYRASK